MKAVENKMSVDIWSDITCVHCYIAKRKFEKALSQFKFRDNVEVTWKSFELAPGIKVKPGQNMYEFLAEYNRATVDEVKEVCNHIVRNAKAVGLHYDFDIAMPANTNRAHRLSHLAKDSGLQNEIKEALFSAHFSQGKNIDDENVLVGIGAAVGINASDLRDTVFSNRFAEDVAADILEAKQKGIKGVPYYLFNGKHALSGTQESDKYLSLLEESFAQWQTSQPVTIAPGKAGAYCEIGGKC